MGFALSFLRRPPRQRASRGTDPGPSRSRISINPCWEGIHHRVAQLRYRGRGKSRSTRQRVFAPVRGVVSGQGGLPQQITVLVVIAVRLVSAWTNNPVLKRVPGVVQVLAVVCGLAYQLGVKTKAGRCFVG